MRRCERCWEDEKMWENVRRWEDVRRWEKMWEDVRRCEKMWEDVRRCEKMWGKMWEDVRRCEKMVRDMWRWEDRRRWEDEMWRWEDVKMRGCEDVKMWRWEDVKMRGCEDERMWRWEDVKMRRCEDEKMWRWEDVKMRGCEDEKMFLQTPHYWKNPALRRSRENNLQMGNSDPPPISKKKDYLKKGFVISPVLLVLHAIAFWNSLRCGKNAINLKVCQVKCIPQIYKLEIDMLG